MRISKATPEQNQSLAQTAVQIVDATPLVGTRAVDRKVLQAIKTGFGTGPFDYSDITAPGLDPVVVDGVVARLASLQMLQGTTMTSLPLCLSERATAALDLLETLQGPKTGLAWLSPRGERSIQCGMDTASGPRLLVITEGETLSEFFTQEDLVDEIVRDTANLAGRDHANTELGDHSAHTALELAKRLNLDGFGDDLAPMARGRAVEILNTLVRNNGREISRKNLIREKVEAGATLQPHVSFGMVLKSPDETFLASDALTKTGMAFAAHLIGLNSTNPGLTPGIAPTGLRQAARANAPAPLATRVRDAVGAMYRDEISSDEAEVRLMETCSREELASFVLDAFNRGWINLHNLGLNDDGRPM